MHADHHDIVYPSAIPFILLHLAAFAAIWTGVSAASLTLCAALYVLRMFAVTGGYHRYFSHRAFATSRGFQLVLACVAQSTAQKSVIWWASKHRHHHLHSDTPDDVHSPRHTGFVYSHLGWLFARQHDQADLTTVADLTRYPELRWLHAHENAPAVALAVLCFVAGGWQGLVAGFVWSTILLWHATFCINSLAHVRGTRAYVTGDDSRNNWLLAIATMGEGWHNNHHTYQSSARQGFRWWQVDATWYILRGLALIGVVRGLKQPPQAVVRGEQRLGAKVVHRTAEQLAARFSADGIVQRLRLACSEREMSALRQSLNEAAASVLHPHLPSRAALMAEAQALYARTPSLEEIVERAHRLVLAAVRNRLAATAA